jgi:hypothetical protein
MRNSKFLFFFISIALSGCASGPTNSTPIYNLRFPEQPPTDSRIAAAGAPGLASGGIISRDGEYVLHTFAYSGVFTNRGLDSAEVLIVGGGGGSGSACGQETDTTGRPGGLRISTVPLVRGDIKVTVGLGGLGGGPGESGRDGSTSAFGQTSVPGGAGGLGSRGVVSSGCMPGAEDGHSGVVIVRYRNAGR